MIRMNDFKADPESLIQEELAACEAVLRSGHFILGEQVRRFEAAWAGACGTRHAVGVANGMDAIEIGLRAIGIGPGDEVITTAMTAFATVLGIIKAGATPVLADIDPATALLDPASVERCITPRTRAVLLVHLYGRLHPMRSWVAFCASRGLRLLEDCAQSHLARADGKCAGAFGDWGAYSFYPTKNLGAIGDAGALVTDRDDTAELAAKLRNYGQSRRYYHDHIGLNSRLDELQAALLNVRLQGLAADTERRRRIATRYFAGIRNARVRLLDVPAEAESHVHHLFVLCCDQRERLMAHLRDAGVESLCHYPVPMHRQTPCTDIARDPAGLPRTEHHAGTCLSIPCHPRLDDAAVEAVVAAVNAFA